MSPSLYELICKWIAALEAKRFENREWIRWADSMLSTNVEPFPWLVELCVANTRESALETLRSGRHAGGDFQSSFVDEYRVKVGFAYRNLRESRIGYPEFADVVRHLVAQLCEEGPEWQQLIDFQVDFTSTPGELRFTRRSEKLFRPYVSLADKWLADLNSELAESR